MTPVGVVVELQPAGLPARVAAYLLDIVVIGTIASVVLAIAGQAAAASGSPTFLAVVLTVVSGTAFVGYPILTESVWNGRTLGKVAAGLRVTTVEGGPIRPRHAAIRGIVLVAEVGSFGLLTIVAALCSRRGRRLGDLAAGTVVVRDRSEASGLSRPLLFSPPPGWERLAATFDTGGIDPALYALVRQYLVRAPSLAPDARAMVGVRLAEVVAARLNRPAPPPASVPEFLLAVAAAAQRRPDRRSAR